jgi:hypothetical protein
MYATCDPKAARSEYDGIVETERCDGGTTTLRAQNVLQTTYDVGPMPSECSARRCREQGRVSEGHPQ